MSEANINFNKLYNSELKEEYFDTQFSNQKTKNTAFFDFLNISKVEKDKKKDAYAFNDLEIASVLKTMESSSVLSIRRMLSTLNDYVSWCIRNGKRGENETYINNVQQFIITEIDVNQYVSNKQVDGKILDEDEFEDLLNILINPMDTAIVLCLYNFVSGKQFYEIRLLTRQDINVENNTLTLTDIDGSTRQQKVEERLITELLLLDKSTSYTSNNGIPDRLGRIKDMQYVDSKYIFKATGLNGTDHRMIGHSTLYTRLREIKSYTGYSYISPTSLRDTRLIHEVWRATSKLGESYPTKEIIHDTLDELNRTYGLYMSHMQRYSLEQKVAKLIELGRFK